MKFDWYVRKRAWLLGHPAALTAVRAADKGAAALLAAGYLGFLAVLFVRGDFARLAPSLFIPAGALAAGTAVRAAINAERPYERPGLEALLPREKPGHSFPSRHVFSAAVIAATLWQAAPWAGGLAGAAALLLAVCRVLGGVHWIRDVAAGLVFGAGFGLAAFWAWQWLV